MASDAASFASDGRSSLLLADLPSGLLAGSELPSEELPQEHHAHAKSKDPAGKKAVATIGRHYYPEGGWGWVVVWAALLVQVLAHGLHTSVGVLVTPAVSAFRPDATPIAASE